MSVPSHITDWITQLETRPADNGSMASGTAIQNIRSLVSEWYSRPEAEKYPEPSIGRSNKGIAFTLTTNKIILGEMKGDICSMIATGTPETKLKAPYASTYAILRFIFDE